MDTLRKLHENGIQLSEENIKVLIEKYNIRELAVFGSSLRNDFNPQSDIDFLIEFNNSENISLFDLLDIQEYLESITGRNVDLVEPESLNNPYRREAILNSKEILYVA
jgi:hypothetical protein